MQGAMLNWLLEARSCSLPHAPFLEFARSGAPAIHGSFPRGTH